MIQSLYIERETMPSDDKRRASCKALCQNEQDVMGCEELVLMQGQSGGMWFRHRKSMGAFVSFFHWRAIETIDE